MPQFPCWCSRANTYQCTPGMSGVLCSRGCSVPRGASCCWPPARSSCLQRIVWRWQRRSLGTRLRTVRHKGSFSPPFPSPGSPTAASQSTRGCGREPARPCCIPGLAVPWEWSCSLSQSGHLRATSQVAKNKTRKGKFGPAPCWVHRAVPVGPSEVGSSAGQDEGDSPWICCVPRQTRGRGPSTRL